MKRLIVSLCAIPCVVFAGGGSIHMKSGESFRITCSSDKLVHTVSPNAVVWKCTGNQDPGPGPGPQPPANCGPPDLQLYPYQEQKLPREQQFENVVSNTVRVYYFDSNVYANSTGRISVAPTPRPSGRPSNSNLTVISECKGDIDINGKDRSCWAAGYQNNLSWTVGRSSANVCGLKANRRYRVNISPRNPVTSRDTCNGTCSVVINTGIQQR